jgi:hypothetical protein
MINFLSEIGVVDFLTIGGYFFGFRDETQLRSLLERVDLATGYLEISFGPLASYVIDPSIVKREFIACQFLSKVGDGWYEAIQNFTEQ